MLCPPIIKRSENERSDEHYYHLRSSHPPLQVHGLQVRGAGV
jgi:hypothetical protein